MLKKDTDIMLTAEEDLFFFASKSNNVFRPIFELEKYDNEERLKYLKNNR